MGTMVAEATRATTGFSSKQVTEWRSQVVATREFLFHRNWKNRRPIVGLRSRVQEDSFRFAVEWCEEFPDVVGRQKQRNRFDKLIALGLDVNAAPETLPDV